MEMHCAEGHQAFMALVQLRQTHPDVMHVQPAGTGILEPSKQKGSSLSPGCTGSLVSLCEMAHLVFNNVFCKTN